MYFCPCHATPLPEGRSVRYMFGRLRRRVAIRASVQLQRIAVRHEGVLLIAYVTRVTGVACYRVACRNRHAARRSVVGGRPRASAFATGSRTVQRNEMPSRPMAHGYHVRSTPE